MPHDRNSHPIIRRLRAETTAGLSRNSDRDRGPEERQNQPHADHSRILPRGSRGRAQENGVRIRSGREVLAPIRQDSHRSHPSASRRSQSMDRRRPDAISGRRYTDDRVRREGSASTAADRSRESIRSTHRELAAARDSRHTRLADISRTMRLHTYTLQRSASTSTHSGERRDPHADEIRTTEVVDGVLDGQKFREYTFNAENKRNRLISIPELGEPIRLPRIGANHPVRVRETREGTWEHIPELEAAGARALSNSGHAHAVARERSEYRRRYNDAENRGGTDSGHLHYYDRVIQRAVDGINSLSISWQMKVRQEDKDPSRYSPDR